MPLQQPGALAPQDRGVLRGGDAFRHRLKAEPLCQPQEVAQKHLVFRAAGEIADKRAVDLDGVDSETLEMAQRGMAGAKIVERNTAAGLAERADKAGRLFDVVERRGFGDLGFDVEDRDVPPIPDQAPGYRLAEPAGGAHKPAQLKEILGNPALLYEVGEKSFRVSAGSFFQTNRHLVRELAQTVVADFFGKIALDLYAGVGLFANHLAKRFEQVFAVESSPASAADLQANALKNVVPICATTEQFLPRCLNMNPEVVVVDPPRAGLGARASQLLAALRVKRIVYVACDPATLARDVRFFLDFGYQVEQVHLIDLFPQTFHLESVIRLVR